MNVRGGGERRQHLRWKKTEGTEVKQRVLFGEVRQAVPSGNLAFQRNRLLEATYWGVRQYRCHIKSQE